MCIYRYRHPHIVQMLGVCVELNAMVMEKLQGTLYQHLHQVVFYMYIIMQQCCYHRILQRYVTLTSLVHE